jgi:hypothetical protein
LLGEYIELVPSDDKYSRVFVIASRSASPIVYWQTGDTISSYQGFLYEHELEYWRPFSEWSDNYSSVTLDAFFSLVSSPNVLSLLGLDQRMVDEARDERPLVCTLYQTTNYIITCYHDVIVFEKGTTNQTIKMDRALFRQFGLDDFYV